MIDRSTPPVNLRNRLRSRPGKAGTFLQATAVILILVAALNPQWNGIYLPTVYVIVAAFAILSGFHYIYWVAKLMREARLNR